MDNKAHITIDIPDEEDFEGGEAYRIAVPETVVSSTIDVLQGILAQWKCELGSEPDHRVWGALMSAAAHALAGLVAAKAAERAETYAAFIAGLKPTPPQAQLAAPRHTPPQAEPPAHHDPGWEF
jgi:hypothetical protein